MTGASQNYPASPDRSAESAPVRAQADLHAQDMSAEREFAEIAGKVVDVTSDAVICVDAGNCIRFWNDGAERMFGYPRDKAIGMRAEQLTASRLSFSVRRRFAESRSGGHPLECEARRADGSGFPVEISLAILSETSSEGGLAAIIRDVSRRKRLERESRQSRALLDSVISNLPATVFLKDAETREYVFINRTGERLLGLPASEIRGSSVDALFPHYALRSEALENQAIAARHPIVEESEVVGADGERRKLRTTRVLIDGTDRPGQYILGLSEDITAARQAEAEIIRLAEHDTLTGLKNRATFSRKLHDLVEAQTPFALLCIDLDRFKAINDQTGHPAGDDVLTEIGRRLQLIVAPDDLIARIGGDEFCIILTGPQLRDRARDIAATALRRIREPCETRHALTRSSASIGIVLFPQDAKTSLDLRQFGDLALYRAKEAGGDNACFFDPRMAVAARSRRALEADLRSAIENGEISVRYQPVLSARTGRIASAEALARWTHPRHGPISPEIFIPMAEEAGLIDVLSNHMLRRACTDALSWPAQTQVAVNLSALQFQTGNLTASVEDLLSATGLPAERLQLEVTEQLLIRDLDRSFAELERLRSLGIQVLMDDFGTGYSSLSYFQRFRFDKVKIDKSFVQNVTTSRTARAIVQAVVGLGEQLQIGVVAEGVETETQMTALTALGCTHLQGFLFSKPLSAAQVLATLGTGMWPVDRQVGRAA